MATGMVRQLDELLACTPEIKVNQIIGDLKVNITAITHDTSKVSSGAMFCCVIGENFDGHDFVKTAVAKGAVALVVERRVETDVTQVIVGEVRLAMGYLAAELFGRPSRQVKVIGVTGTNGKTTTTHLLSAILQQHGWVTSVIGTLTGARTTPESTELQRQLAQELERGCDAVVMEVSSHAMKLRRVEGTSFKAAIFTNLGQDHLDFHNSLEDYFSAKARLFDKQFTDNCIVNRDDVHGALLIDKLAHEKNMGCETFGIADAEKVHADASKLTFVWRGQIIEMAMGGHFNVMNALAAATAAAKLGVTTSDIAKGLAAASAVPGRFEPVDGGQNFSVVVDYAHTPEALKNVLLAARELVDPVNKVIVVFGCGGGRDQLKRSKMGQVSSSYADFVIVTSDNPRNEDAQAIADEIVSGVPARAKNVTVRLDRRQAIDVAFKHANAGDIVIIAGKGHETTQTFGDSEIAFSDVEVSRELLRSVS